MAAIRFDIFIVLQPTNKFCIFSRPRGLG